MTFNVQPTILGVIFGKDSKVVRVAGSSTVWHYWPNGRRVGIDPFGGFDECFLSEIYQREIWKLQEKKEKERKKRCPTCGSRTLE